MFCTRPKKGSVPHHQAAPSGDRDVLPCRAFHISEDVFAGYNATLRGARTVFREYMALGKGRDMGFDSINAFESKVRALTASCFPVLRIAPAHGFRCELGGAVLHP